MSSYIKLVLKDKSEDHINLINQQVSKLGYPDGTFNGMTFGAFPTTRQIRELAHYMNNDPEGLKAQPHFTRPITIDFLQSFYWNERGVYHATWLNSQNPNYTAQRVIIDFCQNNPHYFDMNESFFYR